MFGKSKTEPANAVLRVMNQFGQGTTINGDVVTDGDVRIDGTVTGNVTSRAKVVIGATGVIEGNIVCQNAYVDGRISGTIDVMEMLILSKTAYVAGDIKIKKLVVEEGAVFQGKCSMGMSVAHNTSKTDDISLARPKIANAG